jgi:hydroxymethylglutaryl-CoA lyase
MGKLCSSILPFSAARTNTKPMTKPSIEIVDVGPRDGLQNEERILPTEEKVALIQHLLQAGVKRLEVASFVHPKLVPQMADAENVVAALPQDSDAVYVGLVLNERGLDRALATRLETRRSVDEVGCVAPASDSFAQRNQGQSRADSIAVCKTIIKRAKAEGLRAQVTISTAFGCPFEGEIDPSVVVDTAKALAEAGPLEIALADTIGAAAPGMVSEVFASVRKALPDTALRGHFHDTRNTGVASAWAAYQAGASVIDASVGGLGGCPFAPNATGNVATEDIVFAFERSGVATGLDLPALIETTRWLERRLGKTPPASVSRAGVFPKAA